MFMGGQKKGEYISVAGTYKIQHIISTEFNFKMSEFSRNNPESIYTTQDRLRTLTQYFPDPQKIYFQSLIDRGDSDLFHILSEYDASKISIEEAKDLVTRRVVKVSLDNCYAIYTKLFEHISTDQAKQLVKGSVPVVASPEPSVSLTYGEIDFFSLACILEKANIKEGDKFVDLGHGTGKAIICATLLYGSLLSECWGIELIPELYQVSVSVMAKFRSMVSADSSRFTTDRICNIEVSKSVTSVDAFLSFTYSFRSSKAIYFQMITIGQQLM